MGHASGRFCMNNQARINDLGDSNVTSSNHPDVIMFFGGTNDICQSGVFKNVDFINSLTVKERKNLINKILREQDDIAITKRRFQKGQTIIKHAIVAILTFAISIPVIYYTINASLEASINNYRRSQSMFQTLYKQGGKIKSVH